MYCSGSVSDKRECISYVIINPSYDVKLEVNDIMYVAYFFSSDLFSNFIQILPQIYVYLKNTEITYQQQKYCKSAKLLCFFMLHNTMILF